MASLWTTLGYDSIAAEVADALGSNADIVVLQGPPGVGKSWLARGIGVMWQEGGGGTIVAEGDLLKSDFSFYPLRFAMAGISSGWKSMVSGLAGIAKAGETLVGTAGLITSTVEAIAKARGRRRRDRALFLGDTEQEILFQLER